MCICNVVASDYSPYDALESEVPFKPKQPGSYGHPGGCQRSTYLDLDSDSAERSKDDNHESQGKHSALAQYRSWTNNNQGGRSQSKRTWKNYRADDDQAENLEPGSAAKQYRNYSNKNYDKSHTASRWENSAPRSERYKKRRNDTVFDDVSS